MTGEEVKTVGKELGITQQAMADLCGCPIRTYQRWEEKGVASYGARLLKLVQYPEVRRVAVNLK